MQILLIEKRGTKITRAHDRVWVQVEERFHSMPTTNNRPHCFSRWFLIFVVNIQYAVGKRTKVEIRSSSVFILADKACVANFTVVQPYIETVILNVLLLKSDQLQHIKPNDCLWESTMMHLIISSRLNGASKTEFKSLQVRARWRASSIF